MTPVPKAPDRKSRLQTFVDWTAAHVTGDEKGEAQIFLDRLFQAFGQKGLLEVGGTAEFRIRKAKEDGGGTAFADYVWKPLVLIEMKKRGTDLRRTYRQAFDYWTRLVPGRPNYVVLCNFDEFWVYDFDVQLDEPLDRLRIEELPERFGPLAFLYPTEEKPVFRNNQVEVTRDAADRLAELFNKLERRADVDRDTAQRFVLQCLIALFSEDIGLLEPYFFTRILEECTTPAQAYDLIGGLFVAMNTPEKASGGRFKGVDYFNGGVFEIPARVELHSDELNQLKEAAKQQWSNVRPEIFGTIFQHSVDQEERHAFGAHFTSAVDIMKIIKPTITEPWETLINRAKTIGELRKLHERITHFRVLDPACGSGNFLYLAYRELKRLEKKIFDRMDELSERKDKRDRRLSFVSARQFYGMDILPFAVELAKVTMMIARKLAIEELHMEERALPFDDLDDNFIAGDSLITFPENGAEPFKTPWPAADVIIGNPPFLGAKRLKPERGPAYVNAVRKLYPEVPGMADYCVYWFRRAQDHLPFCTPDDPVAGRAGLVGTQNIRNNKSREGGLDYVVQNGTVVEAVDNQPWSGEAAVHVSIANWVKHVLIDYRLTEREKSVVRKQLLIPESRRLWFRINDHSKTIRQKKVRRLPTTKEYELAWREVQTINSALSDEIDVTSRTALNCNKKPKKCFQGKIPGFEGFLLDESAVRALGGPSNVIVPYLTGRELVGSCQVDRWAIDFGNTSMADASSHSKEFEYLKVHVLPHVIEAYDRAQQSVSDMASARKEHLDRWWQFWNRRDELSKTLNRIDRYIACSRVTRRPVMVFLSSRICPSDLIQVFAFEDNYSFGILQSRMHFDWLKTSSRLKVESDLRYSVREIFDTFPWPQHPTPTDVRDVAEAACEILRIRRRLLPSVGSLRELYRLLELPGKHELKDAHALLDETVRRAYDFKTNANTIEQLLKLNHEIAKAEKAGDPVTSPGIPDTVDFQAELISSEAIEP